MNRTQQLALLKSKKEQLKKLLHQKEVHDETIKKYEEENRILFFGHPGKGYLGRQGTWGPNPLQSQLFPYFRNPDKSIFAYIGPNQIGKTFTAMTVVMLCARGCWPWEDINQVGTWFWDLRKWKPPISIRLVGGDWEKVIRTSIIPKIQEMLPKSWDVTTRSNSVGVKAYWDFKFQHGNGTLDLMSNKSETDTFESWTGHVVIYDEPPEEGKRIACKRGLIANEGIEFFSMTLVSEEWISTQIFDYLDEYGLPLQCLAIVRADDQNVNLGYGLTAKGIKEYQEALSQNQEEYLMRCKGVPHYKLRSVLYNFDQQRHLIIPRKIPRDWIIDVGIDIGLSKPNDLTFLATDSNNIKYVIHAEQIDGYGMEIANRIMELWQEYGGRLNRIVIDPLSKYGQRGYKTIYDVCDAILNDYGFYLELGDKTNKDLGILRINDALGKQDQVPTLYFFRTAQRALQVKKWLNDNNGKPKKGRDAEDDQGENLYRLMLLDTAWEPMSNSLLENEEEEICVKKKSNNPCGY